MPRIMANLVDEFEHTHEYQDDVWVADYTEKTRYLPDSEKKGVRISESVFADIESFHLQNPKHVAMYGVNFEEHPNYFPGGVKNCECLFRAKDVVDGGFLLLCELKYCNLQNIPVNADKAYEQLKSTWSYLEGRRLFDKKRCKSFLNISVPEHGENAPFSSFTATQDDELKWIEDYGINILGENNLLVLDKGVIRVPDSEI